MSADPAETERRFLVLLQRAFAGWRAKIEADFSSKSYTEELASLQSDDVYRMFGLAVPEYVLIRLMGRVSISIGRRLGELYDALPKYVAAARFGLDPKDVAAKIEGLNLDVCVPFGLLQVEDQRLAANAVSTHLGQSCLGLDGLGIEIRYNFNPNDSARLRKDVAMAEGLRRNKLLPIYLVYSGISPRDEAIGRLKRAGWHFLVAQEASLFTKTLLGLDLGALLSDPLVQQTIGKNVDAMMLSLVDSHAFGAATAHAARRRQAQPPEGAWS